MGSARFGTYRTGGAEEPLIARGPESGWRVLIVPPLFEEANRCRALLAELQRLLAADRIGSALIDLPGTGDSERALDAIVLEDWIAAVAAAAAAVGPDVVIGSVRGGALLDGEAQARGRWRFSPVDGAALLRDLDRAQQIAAKRDGIPADGVRAGYPISDHLAQGLAAAKPRAGSPVHTVRLESEAAAADARVAGPPLWRRPEPEQDLALAARLASDLVSWVRTCGG
jgi:hypothetical protein